jgi:hypothetical protein
MGKIGKTFALFLTLAIIMSCLTLLIVKPANAESTSKPPVPQFSTNISDHTYVVPEQVSIDQYTGAKTTIPAYSVINVTLTVTIANSPLATAYVLEVKGHYGSDWLRPTMNDPMSNGIFNITALTSSGAQTVITLSGSGDTQVTLGFSDHWSITVPSGGQLDLRLEAINGEVGSRVFGGSIYVGESSDWSPVQTITIPENLTSPSQSSPSPTPTPSPTVPELSWLVIVPLLLSVFAVALVLRHRKTANLK